MKCDEKNACFEAQGQKKSKRNEKEENTPRYEMRQRMICPYAVRKLMGIKAEVKRLGEESTLVNSLLKQEVYHVFFVFNFSAVIGQCEMGI